MAEKENRKKAKLQRNPFVVAARKRISGPIKDRSEKRLQNKRQKEEQEEG
ncbi:MAG: hypothetical protein AAB317_01900 [Nitrospirota bacterium]